MQEPEIIPHLFRTEFRKIVSVLSKHFGIGHIEVAEDIAGDAFLAALNTWPYKGIPENPTAWLYTVAKNKARNFLTREKLFRQKIAVGIKNEMSENGENDIDLSEKNITDSQLQMLFAICHPKIPEPSQIGLALRILCGFGIEEIANAFLTDKEVINKRLFRAKEKLRTENVKIEFPSNDEIDRRLNVVLSTIYLLFNEGYYSESHEPILREDLCFEAMRLTYLLTENEITNKPAVHALLALMCFHASRFPARKSDKEEFILYRDQDESLWDKKLISEGARHLHLAATGPSVSKYHLEATIAYWHTNKKDSREKWESILTLYNQLLAMQYSPIAALNRTYALSKVHGNKRAIAEAEQLGLSDNQYYFVLLGELYKDIDSDLSRQHFEKAFSLAKTQTDRQTISLKL